MVSDITLTFSRKIMFKTLIENIKKINKCGFTFCKEDDHIICF